MTFLAPGFLAAAAAAALGVLLLHLFSYQRPRPRPLPTARFLPDRPVRAVATFRRPTDLLLLALRALALLLVGAAFAGPVRPPARGTVARVVLVDGSRAVASPSAARDSLRAIARAGDAVILFTDTAAAPVLVRDPSTLRDAAAAPAGAPGSLSAALAAAGRGARLVRGRADSVELVIVSPVVREELDAATLDIRRGWPGRARLVTLAATAQPTADTARPAVALRAAGADDPLAATFALAARAAADAPVRVVRAAPTAEDSAWARAAAGRRLVVWPENGAPAGWPLRRTADTVGALTTDGAVLVAPLVRRAAPPPDDSGAVGARVVARWVDGEPAAIERALGTGCARTVAVEVPPIGDLAIARPFVRLAAALLAPCGAPTDLRLADRATLSSLAGSGPLAAAARVGGGAESGRSPLAPWLLAAAAALLVGELALRRGGAVEGDA